MLDDNPDVYAYWWQCVMPYMKNEQILSCPSETTRRVYSGGQSDPRHDIDYTWNTFLNTDPLADIKYPSACVNVVEGTNNYARLYCPGCFPSSTNNYVWAQTRHNGTSNVLFVDGHVKNQQQTYGARTPGSIDFHFHETFHP